MRVTPDESAPSRVPRSGEHDRARAQGPGSSSRDRFESFIEPPIVGIGGSVTGARRLLCPYNFEACRAGSTLHPSLTRPRRQLRVDGGPSFIERKSAAVGGNSTFGIAAF